MVRKLLLIVVGVILLSTPVLAQKAGVGAWENPRYTMIRWIEDTPGLGWYYNWRTDQIWSRQRPRRDVEFVPMIHGAKDVNKPIQSDRRVTTLLGFNEPDGHGGDHQAGLSVEQAIALWPKLQARGLRLGSPATTRDQTLGRNSWQGRFMAEVERRGLRVDFMAVHYYTTDGDVEAFRRWLTQVNREYRRPIWVTEFAYIDWNRPGAASYARNAAFAEGAMKMMERLPFVERYAWFAANPYPWKGRTPKINLVDNNLRPTLVGRAYDRMMAAFVGLTLASAE
ncbi:MAG: glycosyl hydrolase [Rhodovulum sp.]